MAALLNHRLQKKFRILFFCDSNYMLADIQPVPPDVPAFMHIEKHSPGTASDVQDSVAIPDLQRFHEIYILPKNQRIC